MIIGIEIDNILSTPVSNFVALTDVEKCKPLDGAKESIEKLKELGHTIVIYTLRDASLGPSTETWLQRNKIPYDRIILNKPNCDIIIDNRSYKFKDWSQFFEDNKYKLHNLR